MRLLLVEDHGVVRDAMADAIHAGCPGLTDLVAVPFSAAVAALQGQRFDLIVLAAQPRDTPDAEAVRRLCNGTPVLAVTAAPSPELAAELRAAGVCEVVDKAAGPGVLCRIIHRCAGSALVQPPD